MLVGILAMPVTLTMIHEQYEHFLKLQINGYPVPSILSIRWDQRFLKKIITQRNGKTSYDPDTPVGRIKDTHRKTTVKRQIWAFGLLVKQINSL